MRLTFANRSVKIWSDTQCSLLDVFKAPSSPHRCNADAGIIVTEGITAKPKVASSTPRRQDVSSICWNSLMRSLMARVRSRGHHRVDGKEEEEPLLSRLHM